MKTGFINMADKKAIGILHTDSSAFLSGDIIIDNDSDNFHFTDSVEQKRVLLSSKLEQKNIPLFAILPNGSKR